MTHITIGDFAEIRVTNQISKVLMRKLRYQHFELYYMKGIELLIRRLGSVAASADLLSPETAWMVY